MSLLTPVYFNDSIELNSETANYDLLFGADEVEAFEAEVNYRGRMYNTPRRDSVSYTTKDFPFILIHYDTPNHQVWRDFKPHGGLRVLDAEVEIDDVVYLVELLVDISSMTYQTSHFIGTFSSQDGIWKVKDYSGPETINAGVSGVVEASGNSNALPSLKLTPVDTQVRRVTCVINDQSGHGVKSYPYRIRFNGSGIGASNPENYDVVMNGRSVPFKIFNQGSTSTDVWLRVDLFPNLTITYPNEDTTPTTVDIYFGADVWNPINANLMDDGNMNLPASSNTKWVTVVGNSSENPQSATGVWRPQLEGEISGGAVVTHESESSTIFEVNTRGNQIFNCLGIMTGIPISGTMTGLYRIASPQEGFHLRAFVRYQVRGSSLWRIAYEGTTIGGIALETSAPIDLDGAMRVVIGIDANPSWFHFEEFNEAAGELRITGSAVFSLKSDEIPLAEMFGPVPASVIHGILVNETTESSISFDRVYTDGVPLVIDTENYRFGTEDESSFYVRDVDWEHLAEWFHLEPGENTIVPPCNLEITWRDRWIIY